MFRSIATWFGRLLGKRPLPVAGLRDPRQVLGEAGERAAETHLTKFARMKILARRFRAHGGEIDLVCRDGETIVFVEVKARRDEKFMDAIDAVTPEKQRRMITAANAYLAKYRLDSRPARFDIVTVVGAAPDFRVLHTRDAFTPGVR
ncbi:MAG: YraN family protein [Phycisphaerae bacterium]|nr:YraN family protein [Phycisphaerae bacterium]